MRVDALKVNVCKVIEILFWWLVGFQDIGVERARVSSKWSGSTKWPHNHHFIAKLWSLEVFMCPSLRVQPPLLQRMVAMWYTDSQHFMVGDQTLEIKVDDIYFLTGLSRRGESVYFGVWGGSRESIDSYVSDLCVLGTRKQGGKLPIKHVIDVSLKTILFIVTWLVGSTSTHLDSMSQVLISLKATNGVVFDWCSGLLANLKDQFTHCHLGRHKQFSYGSILACFFFQRVPVMRPWEDIPSIGT